MHKGRGVKEHDLHAGAPDPDPFRSSGRIALAGGPPYHGPFSSRPAAALEPSTDVWARDSSGDPGLHLPGYFRTSYHPTGGDPAVSGLGHTASVPFSPPYTPGSLPPPHPPQLYTPTSWGTPGAYGSPPDAMGAFAGHSNLPPPPSGGPSGGPPTGSPASTAGEDYIMIKPEVLRMLLQQSNHHPQQPQQLPGGGPGPMPAMPPLFPHVGAVPTPAPLHSTHAVLPHPFSDESGRRGGGGPRPPGAVPIRYGAAPPPSLRPAGSGGGAGGGGGSGHHAHRQLPPPHHHHPPLDSRPSGSLPTAVTVAGPAGASLSLGPYDAGMQHLPPRSPPVPAPPSPVGLGTRRREGELGPGPSPAAGDPTLGTAASLRLQTARRQPGKKARGARAGAEAVAMSTSSATPSAEAGGHARSSPPTRAHATAPTAVNPTTPSATATNTEGGTWVTNGSSYTVNQWYEGFVKRYNPMRGFGFLTGTHLLLFDAKQCEEDLADYAALLAGGEREGRDVDSSASLAEREGGDGGALEMAAASRGDDAGRAVPRQAEAAAAGEARHTTTAAALPGERAGQQAVHDPAPPLPPGAPVSAATTPAACPDGGEVASGAAASTPAPAATPAVGAQHGTVVPSTMQWYLQKLAAKAELGAAAGAGAQLFPRGTLTKVDASATLGDIFVHHSCISMDEFRVLPVNALVRFSVSVIMNTVQAVDVVPLEESFWPSEKRPGGGTHTSGRRAAGPAGLEPIPAFTVSPTAQLVLDHHRRERHGLGRRGSAPSELGSPAGAIHGASLCAPEGEGGAGGPSPVPPPTFWSDMAVVPSPAVPNAVTGRSELQAVRAAEGGGSPAPDVGKTGAVGGVCSVVPTGPAMTPAPPLPTDGAAVPAVAVKTSVTLPTEARFKDTDSSRCPPEVPPSTLGGMTSSKNHDATTTRTGAGSGSDNRTGRKAAEGHTNTTTTTNTRTADENRSSENVLGIESSESRHVKDTTDGTGPGTGDNTTSGNEDSSHSGLQRVHRQAVPAAAKSGRARVDHTAAGPAAATAVGASPVASAAAASASGNDRAAHGGAGYGATGAGGTVAHSGGGGTPHHSSRSRQLPLPDARPHALLDDSAGRPTAAAAADVSAQGVSPIAKESGGQEAAVGAAGPTAAVKAGKPPTTPARGIATTTPGGGDAASSAESQAYSPSSGLDAFSVPSEDWSVIFDKKMDDERQKDILLHKGDYLKNFFPSQQLQQQQQQERAQARRAAAAAAAAAMVSAAATPLPSHSVGDAGALMRPTPMDILPLSAVGELDSSSSRGIESQRNVGVDETDGAGSEPRLDVSRSHARGESPHEVPLGKVGRSAPVEGAAAAAAATAEERPLSGQGQHGQPVPPGPRPSRHRDPLEASGRMAAATVNIVDSEHVESSGEEGAAGRSARKGRGTGVQSSSSSGPMPQTTVDDSGERVTTPHDTTDAEPASGSSVDEKHQGRSARGPVGHGNGNSSDSKPGPSLRSKSKWGESARPHPRSRSGSGRRAMSDGEGEDTDTPHGPMPVTSSHLQGTSGANGVPAARMGVLGDGKSADAASPTSAGGSTTGASLISDLMMIPVSLLPPSLSAQVPPSVTVIALPRSVVAGLGLDEAAIHPYLSAAAPMGVYCNSHKSSSTHKTGSRRSFPSSGTHQSGGWPAAPGPQVAAVGAHPQGPSSSPLPPLAGMPASGAFPRFSTAAPPASRGGGVVGSSLTGPRRSVTGGGSAPCTLRDGYASASSSSASPGAGVTRGGPQHPLALRLPYPPPQAGLGPGQGYNPPLREGTYWSDDSSENAGGYKAVFLFNPEQDALWPRSTTHASFNAFGPFTTDAESASGGGGGGGGSSRGQGGRAAGGRPSSSPASAAAHAGLGGPATRSLPTGSWPSGMAPGSGARPGGGTSSTGSSSSLGEYRHFSFPVPPRVPLHSVEMPPPPWLNQQQDGQALK